MIIDPAHVLVTGANGVLGRHLLRTLAASSGSGPAAAVVRSEGAAATVRSLPTSARPDVHVVDYRDVEGLTKAMQGRRFVVHLVGILKESKRAPYVDAHENATAAVAEAAARAGVEHIVYLSILGSEPDSPNACLASKGRAEQALLTYSVPATVIRLPMVLGEGDLASRALRRQAQARILPLLDGGKSLEQPIDAEDVVQAILGALSRPGLSGRTLDLAGPESLRARELVLRAAALHGNRPRFVAVPAGLARLAVRMLERFMETPPVTEAMLGVLLHDDRIDPLPAARDLGIELTPLDEMLARRIGPDAPAPREEKRP